MRKAVLTAVPLAFFGPGTVAAATRIGQALAFIDQNLDEGLTLPRIAQALTLSPCHFAHVFKRATGMAPHRYPPRACR